jgi:hypothetical protein
MMILLRKPAVSGPPSSTEWSSLPSRDLACQGVGLAAAGGQICRQRANDSGASSVAAENACSFAPVRASSRTAERVQKRKKTNLDLMHGTTAVLAHSKLYTGKEKNFETRRATPPGARSSLHSLNLSVYVPSTLVRGSPLFRWIRRGILFAKYHPRKPSGCLPTSRHRAPRSSLSRSGAHAYHMSTAAQPVYFFGTHLRAHVRSQQTDLCICEGGWPKKRPSNK